MSNDSLILSVLIGKEAQVLQLQQENADLKKQLQEKGPTAVPKDAA